MKLFLISQSTNNEYDTYSDAVVCAADEESARRIHPDGTDRKIDSEGYFLTEWDNKWERETYSNWCYNIKDVSVVCIGEAEDDLDEGVICASFHAG